MKRKQAITRNMGPTCGFISIEDLNRIRNGLLPRAVSANNGVDVFGGTDYSYMNAQGTRSAAFRKKFPLYGRFDFLSKYNPMRDEWLDNVYHCGYLDEPNSTVGRVAWYWYGYRMVIEFFDTNAIVDFTGPIDKGAILSYCFGQFLVVFGKQYDVKVINEHLLSVSERNGKEND